MYIVNDDRNDIINIIVDVIMFNICAMFIIAHSSWWKNRFGMIHFDKYIYMYNIIYSSSQLIWI